jgi:hypothetical protein
MRMRQGVLLGIIFAGVGFQTPPAQKPALDAATHYRLFQVLQSSSVQEKINEAAGQGYRLVRLVNAPGGTVAAIMENVGSPTDPYAYAFQDVKTSHGHQAVADLQEQLNALGARGFHLQTILSSNGSPLPGLLVMEKAPGPPSPARYEVLLQGMDSFNKKKIAALIDQGFRLSQSAWLWRPMLIFEKIPETRGNPAIQAVRPSQGYRFLVSRWAPQSLPEKELQKLAAEGERVVVVFQYGESPITAMEPAARPSAPYEYLVIKPKRISSALAWRVEWSRVGEEDLNRAGEKGFRLFQQNTAFIPFLMEKAPGGTERFQYRLLESARLAELSQQLEEARGQGYQVVAMFGRTDGMAITGPPAQAGDQHAGITIVMERPQALGIK